MKFIRNVHHKWGIKIVHFTGAELYINEEVLLRVSMLAATELGIKVIITTSLYWAIGERSFEKGTSYLTQACISRIIASLDTYHWTEEKLQVLSNRITSLKEQNFEIEIRSVVENKNNLKLIKNIIPKGVAFTFLQPSAVGRNTKPLIRSTTFNVPYCSCDFGKVIYLENDGKIYGCSGPGNALQSRSIGKINSDGEINLIPTDKFDLIEKSIPDINSKYSDKCGTCNTTFYSLP